MQDLDLILLSVRTFLILMKISVGYLKDFLTEIRKSAGFCQNKQISRLLAQSFFWYLVLGHVFVEVSFSGTFLFGIFQKGNPAHTHIFTEHKSNHFVVDFPNPSLPLS